MSGQQQPIKKPMGGLINLTDAEKDFIKDLLGQVQVKPVDTTSIEVCERVQAILAKLSNE